MAKTCIYKTKTCKVGNSHDFRIPAYFIKNNIIQPGKLYELTVKRVDGRKSKKKVGDKLGIDSR